MGFPVLQLTKVVADFQTLQIPLGVFLLKGLVHALKLSLSLLRQFLFSLLTLFYPFQRIVCVRIGVTQSSSLEGRIELSLVSHPANIA